MSATEQLTLLNLENLINNYVVRNDQATKEIKSHSEMLDSILENNDEYQKACEDAAKYSKLKTIAKQKALSTGEAKRLSEVVKDLRVVKKEINYSLSDYLSQYVNLAGTNQIEGKDGVVRQIISSAKLVKIK